MKIFISWSGDHSKAIASALNVWLPKVFHSATTFFSEDDIKKGDILGYQNLTAKSSKHLGNGRFYPLF